MQELRFKIRGTEAANIEIQPCPDGSVDIVVKYGEPQNNYGSSNNKPSNYKKTYTKPNKSNIEILKNYCGELKNDEDIDIKELTNFYKFYEGKIEDWKGVIQPEKLWQRWKETSINK